MFAVTGITGQVGGAAARTLLDRGLSVHGVMRDAAKCAAWRERGFEIALAGMNDAGALTAALTGVEGVFLMIPPIFDPTPGFPEARGIIATVMTAIEAAKPSKVVCLSTIGAQATQPNLLIVELEGPRRITPNQIAATFAEILGRPVRMEAVPRDAWEELFASQGIVRVAGHEEPNAPRSDGRWLQQGLD
jgi:uncharacterized protein YbjT (DUF2867 family)